MTDRNWARPRLGILSDEQLARVHRYSLDVLSEVGVRVDSERACRLYRRALGESMVQGGRIRIPGELVEWALHVAPRQVELYDRGGSLAFRLPGETRFGIGVTALYYQDPATDDVVPFGRRHMGPIVRLGSSLPAFDVISTPGIVQDLPPEDSDLYAVLEMVANTRKPLVLLVSDEQAFPAVLGLVEHLCGDQSERASVLPYLNPISPLVINQSTVDKMWTCAERGLPFIYSNYGMAGASTPITPAGALLQLNAELLAGLTLGQLIRQGSPMVLGSLPAYFDMKGKGSFYVAQSYAVDLACAEMMTFYGLPHAGTSGAGVGWGADVLAAGHQWTNHLVSCLGKVGLAPFVGDNLGSMAFAPALVAYANEVIEQARILARGFSLDDGAMALGEIAEVGPGGSFLTSPSTLRLFRGGTYRSQFLQPLTLDDWLARGRPQAGQALRDHTRQLLADARPPQDHSELMARGEAFIGRLLRQ